MNLQLRRATALLSQVLAATALGAVSYEAFAQEKATIAVATTAKPVDAKAMALEEWFWRCDYVATTQRMGYAAAEECMIVTEEFKKTKFAGDFDALYQYWRAHKAAAHEKIRTAP